jgi:23S rRNA pseudouridine1911/1915/1917 synthase
MMDETTLNWTMPSCGGVRVGRSGCRLEPDRPQAAACSLHITLSVMRDTWVIASAEDGGRLDRFLAADERLGSRGRVVDALQRGRVFLNDSEVGPAGASLTLRAGDRVCLWMDRPGSANRRHLARSRRGGASLLGVEIVFEDAVLLVVNKPAGLLTVPLPRGPGDASVYAQLVEHFRSRKRTPCVVHRIDRDTSGLVVFAKDARTQQAIKEQFIRREPERVYLAVVAGRPSPPEGTWSDHLVWDPISRAQKEADRRDRRGVEAISTYRVVEALSGASLIEIRLHTGKRNQIRIQAALRGHPLIGERQYGRDAAAPRSHARNAITFPRQALHAWRLGFEHPHDRRALTFEAPLPQDMASLLERLGRRAHVRR